MTVMNISGDTETVLQRVVEHFEKRLDDHYVDICILNSVLSAALTRLQRENLLQDWDEVLRNVSSNLGQKADIQDNERHANMLRRIAEGVGEYSSRRADDTGSLH